MNSTGISDQPATISDQIVQFAVNTQSADLPDSALQVLQLSLVDWVTVAIAGANEPVAKITRALVEREGGAQASYALGVSQQVPVRAAALVNGACGHALDYDDTHFASLGHPSAAVFPAALAIADSTGASAEQVKHAALIGMEIAVRIGVWLGRDHYRSGFHITGTAGTFGAAMVASRLLSLSIEQTRHALGIAASRASGIKAQFGSMGKPMHAGFAASNGVESALLAQLGFTAGTNALESSQGFAQTHHGECNNEAFEEMGSEFLFENVSHKFHACCHGTHAAMEALVSIRDQQQLQPETVKSITITVHPQYLDICNIVSPSTGLQAKFSYQMVAALVLHRYDTARMDTFTDALCTDSDLRNIHDCVRVETDANVPETSAVVNVTLSDGSSYNATHDLLAPVELPERQSRVRGKCASILGSENEDDLWSRVAQGNTTATQWIKEYLHTSGADADAVVR